MYPSSAYNSINTVLPLAQFTSSQFSHKLESSDSGSNHLQKTMRADAVNSQKQMLPGHFSSASHPLSSTNILVYLEDRELWTQFYQLTNEMILTKAGR